MIFKLFIELKENWKKKDCCNILAITIRLLKSLKKAINLFFIKFVDILRTYAILSNCFNNTILRNFNTNPLILVIKLKYIQTMFIKMALMKR